MDGPSMGGDEGLIEAIAVGVVLIEPDPAPVAGPALLRVRAANAAALKALGVTQRPVPGTPLDAALPPLAATESVAALRRALSRNKRVRFALGFGEVEANPHEGGLVVTLRRVGTADDTALTDRLELATEANGIGIWEHLPQQDRLMWNAPMFELFGISPDRFRGRTADWADSVHPDDRPEAYARHDAALASTGDTSYTYRILRPDGTVRHIEARARVVERDAEGRAVRIVGINQDITEERLARDRAEAAEQRLMAAVEALPDGFVIYDQDDRLLICNSRYRELYAESAPAMVPGTVFADVIRYGIAQGQYPEAAGREAAFLEERLALHTSADRLVEQQLPGNRWVQVVERRTAHGDTVGFRVDITTLKRQQQELEFFLSVAQDLLSVATADGRIVKAGEAWRTVMGYDPAAMAGQRHIDCLAPDDLPRSRSDGEALLRDGRLGPVKYRYRHGNGQWRWLEWYVVMGKDGLAYSSARDVTDREAELQRRSHKAAEEQVLSAVMAGALSARSEPAVIEAAIEAMTAELPWVSALGGFALDLFPADAADAFMHRAHATGAPPAPNAVLACMLSARAQAAASASAGGGATAVIIAGPEADDACVPIQDGDRLIGVLTLSGVADAMSLGLETDFLSRLAAALALALAHQRKTREAERERLTALAALAEVSSYRAALERHMIVLETDRDGRITKVNAHFERLTGYSAGEVIDRNPRLLNSGLHTPDHFATMWQTILAGEPWHGEHCNRAKDGQLYWVQVTIIPVPGDDGGIARFVALQVDITERKRLAETLTVTNRRLERLAAVSGVGGWERDLETGVVEWDEGLRRIYEVSPDLVPGNALRLSHFPPEVASMLAAAAERCAADGTPLDFEVPAVTYSGKPIWVRVAAVAVWEDGRITRLSGAVQDITVRKLREAETERLRARFEAIFENTGSLIFMKNREGRFIGANGRFLAAVQRPDVTGLTDFDLTPHAVAEKLDAVDRRVFETGQPMLVEESVIRPSGAHQFFVSSKFLIDDPLLGDKIMVGIATDVTAMKKRDAENARLRQRFDAFMENASALIFLKRRDGSFITGNRRLLDFLGLHDEAELRGRLSADFSPPEIVEALQSVDRRVFETGLPSFVEEMVIRDGIARYFLTSKFLIPDAEEGDLVLCAIATEITEQKRLQASLEAATREAEAASLAKSQFLATMSHEIRTPMNGVIGMAELLARAVTDPEHRRMVGVIRESGDVLLNVINDILDFSKIEVGRVELESVPFSLREIGRKVESVHALKAAEKGLTFEMLFGVGIEALWLGDPHRLQQVLHNLVGNAVKFTEKGEVSVALRATAPDTVVITVRDTGLGMTAEQQGRIFEEFAQADSSTTRRFGGTGLGLPIAKGLVEAMGGTIAVVSEASRGTSFTVTLPLPLAPAASASTRPADAAEVLPEGLVVLAADDNEVNRMVLSAYLGSLGVRVVMVDGGAAAVALRDSEPFDALLLDIAMPGMDGIEALTAIRARETALGLPRIPAVAVTANAMSHQIEEYLAAGFDAHVAKPIRRERLVEALQALGAARDIRRGRPG